MQVGAALLASAEGYTPRANQLIDAARERIAPLPEIAAALAENLPAPKSQPGRSRRRRRRKRGAQRQAQTQQQPQATGAESQEKPAESSDGRPRRRRRRRPRDNGTAPEPAELSPAEPASTTEP